MKFHDQPSRLRTVSNLAQCCMRDKSDTQSRDFSDPPAHGKFDWPVSPITFTISRVGLISRVFSCLIASDCHRTVSSFYGCWGNCGRSSENHLLKWKSQLLSAATLRDLWGRLRAHLRLIAFKFLIIKQANSKHVQDQGLGRNGSSTPRKFQNWLYIVPTDCRPSYWSYTDATAQISSLSSIGTIAQMSKTS